MESFWGVVAERIGRLYRNPDALAGVGLNFAMLF
jgi:hypothetical protein